MPRMRHGLGDARDAGAALEPSPRASTSTGAPRKKVGRPRGPKVSRREGRGGTRRSRRGRSRRGDALGRGARAAARPRRRGLAEGVARRARPPRFPRSVASKTKQARRPRRAPPPSPSARGDTCSWATRSWSPSRRAAAETSPGGPRIRASRAARGTTRAPSDFRRRPTLAKEERDEASGAPPPSPPPRADTPPWRPCASPRARGVTPVADRPDARPDARGSKPSGDDTSLCARILAARADTAAADVRPRPVGSVRVDRRPRFSPPRHPPLPNSPRWWTRSRRRSACFKALPRRSSARTRRGEVPALGARRRRRGAPTDCSYADPRLCSRCSTRTRRARRRARSSATRRTVVTARAVRRSRRTRAPLRTERSERNARRRARGPGPGCRFAARARRRPPRPPRRRG